MADFRKRQRVKPSRLARFLFGATLTAYVVGVAGLIYLWVAAHRPPAGARAEQDRIVEAIQAFRERHNRLPTNLEEAGVTFDRNLFDSVYYDTRYGNPNEFMLTCSRDYWGPEPRTHWWYYESDCGGWRYHNESD